MDLDPNPDFLPIRIRTQEKKSDPDPIPNKRSRNRNTCLEVLADLLQVEVADGSLRTARRVVVLEALQELGDEGDVLLADLFQLLRHIGAVLFEDLNVEPSEKCLQSMWSGFK